MHILCLPNEILFQIFTHVWKSSTRLQDRCSDTLHCKLTCKHFNECVNQLHLFRLAYDPVVLIPRFIRFKTPSIYICKVLSGVVNSLFNASMDLPLMFWNHTTFNIVKSYYMLPIGYKRYFKLRGIYHFYTKILINRVKHMWDHMKKPVIRKYNRRRKACYFKLGFAIDKDCNIKLKHKNEVHYLHEWHPELLMYFKRDCPNLTTFNYKLAYAPGKVD